MSYKKQAFLLASLCSLVACKTEEPTTNTPPPNLTLPSGVSGASSSTGTQSCLDVLKCVAACTTGDACISQCVEKGTSTALTQLEALVQCDADKQCDGDGTCLNEQCTTQVNNCTGSTGSVGASGAAQSDGFDVSAEFWTIAGDAQSSSVAPDFNGTGGNPGGLISADDDVAGGTWYFVAPAKYLGNQSAVAGLTLQYDLKVTPISSLFGNYDVILAGGGVVVVYDTTPEPSTTWTHYSVPLSAAGWKTVSSEYADQVEADEFAALPNATASDFATVLSNMTLLRIRGEFNTGSDTGSLDNVRWGQR